MSLDLKEIQLKFLNKTLLAATVAAISMSPIANAQQKIGVVNMQGVFQSLPQAAAIQQNIAAEFKDDFEAVSRLEKDLQYYMEKQKRDTATMSATEVDELNKKIGELRSEYATKAQPLQQNVQRRQGEERDKILGLIRQSIDNIAAKEQYDLVLSSNSVLYIDDTHNLSQQVIDQVSKIK